MSAGLLNFEAYTVPEIVLYCSWAALWAGIYGVLLRNIHRYKFVAMPALACCAYTSYDLLWGFYFPTNMGSVVSLGLKIFGPLDLYFLWVIYRHGEGQLFPGLRRPHIALILSFSVLAWMVFLYFFCPAVDDPAGASTSFMLMLFQSAMAIPMLLKAYAREGAQGLAKMSYAAGWLRLMANTCGTLFCFSHLPERRWLLTVCVVMITLDLTYVVVFHRLRSAVARGLGEDKADPLLKLGAAMRAKA